MIINDLTRKKDIFRFILSVAFFAIIFVLIYKPAGFQYILKSDNNLTWFLECGTIIGVGMIILISSRLILYRVSQKRELTDLQYAVWLIGEIFLLTFILTLWAYFLNPDGPSFLDMGFRMFVNIISILAIPYTIGTLLEILRLKNRKLAESENRKIKVVGSQPTTINFYDRNGKFTISIKKEDILYIKSADNYVEIFYLDEGKVMNQLLRNSLRNIENMFVSAGLIRCHRLYVVNMQKVKLVKRSKESILVLELSETTESIPVSSTYAKSIMQYITETSAENAATE
jgi:hypothetical protein